MHHRKKAWAVGGDEQDRPPSRSPAGHLIEDTDHDDSIVLASGDFEVRAFATGFLGLADTGIINNWNDGNGS